MSSTKTLIFNFRKHIRRHPTASCTTILSRSTDRFHPGKTAVMVTMGPWNIMFKQSPFVHERRCHRAPLAPLCGKSKYVAHNAEPHTTGPFSSAFAGSTTSVVAPLRFGPPQSPFVSMSNSLSQSCPCRTLCRPHHSKGPQPLPPSYQRWQRQWPF